MLLTLKTSEMNRYKKMCDEYRYRIYCVDMTTVPIEVTKERNRGRQELKRVPEEVIDKMYARFETQKIPSGIKVIQPDELNAVFYEEIQSGSVQTYPSYWRYSWM